MAAEDFGGTVLGRPVEVLQIDTQNKPDVGTFLVKEGFDRQDVRAVLDGSASSVGFAIQTLAKQSGRMFLSPGSFTSELAGARPARRPASSSSRTPAAWPWPGCRRPWPKAWGPGSS